MKRLRFALILLIVHAAVFAQQKPAPTARPKSAARRLQVEVFHFGENGARMAEAGLFVTLKQNGASKQTNDLGQCWLELPEGYAAGEMVTLVIDKTDWRIRYPLDGEARIPLDLKKETVEVELLPVGSKLFWTNDRIEKLVRDMAAKSTQQTSSPNPENKPNFGRFIKDWAVQYGFGAEQAKAEMDKWIAEIEAKSNDLNRLGLAAFAKKNFAEAAKNFEAAFAQDSTQLAATKKQKQALEEKEKQLTTQAIENARLAGDSHFNDNQFDKALAAYHSAQQLVDKTQAPQQWANLALAMGNANRNLGTRAAGDKISAYLNAAQQAYQQAGEVWPREREPEGWAAVQVGLGNVLSDLGIRTGGEEGAQLLSQAVEAYRAALVVYTFEHIPTYWATAQNNLAKTYVLLEDWPNVASCYANVLKVYPQYEEAYQTASYLYHEALFNFTEAFVLNQNWLAQFSEDLSAQCDFAERHFTTSRFAACEQDLVGLLANAEVEPRTKIALRAIGIANALAQNQTQQVPAALETLQAAIAAQPDTFKVGWSFEGTKHFISTNETLAPYRAWLLQFFAALERKEGRAAILAGVEEVRKNFNEAK
ncbi:hypothetical protein HUU05_21815 [candidate division KSB1 bacterium]|nr:hypothetical protein [candidate division KSB1 bacterium]